MNRIGTYKIFEKEYDTLINIQCMKTFEQYTQSQDEPHGILFVYYLNYKLGRDIFQYEDSLDDNDYVCIYLLPDEEYRLYTMPYFSYTNMLEVFGDALIESSNKKQLKVIHEVYSILKNFSKDDYDLFIDSEELGLL